MLLSIGFPLLTLFTRRTSHPAISRHGSNRKIEFIWIEYEPGSVTHPEPMSHPGEENAICLEGTVVVIIEDQEFRLAKGDSISFDSGRPHQVENRSNKRAILVSAITPPAF